MIQCAAGLALLYPCPECVRNAVLALGEVLGGITNENETPGRADELLCPALLLHKNDDTADF